MKKYLNSLILTQNSKMKKTSKKVNKRIFNFGLPAYKSKTGTIICKYALDCIKYCYACKGAYIWSNVAQAFEKRYLLTLDQNFISIMEQSIISNKVDVLRIHDSGDFYNYDYFVKWCLIASIMPNVQFYAYTKAIPYINKYKRLFGSLPGNFTLIYSLGGHKDNEVDTTKDRHSKIFNDINTLLAAGYIDCSDNDYLSFTDKNHRIGLIAH